MSFIVAANWKLNHGLNEANDYSSQLAGTLSESEKKSVVIFPPAFCLSSFFNSGLAFGIQNAYWEESGAYTGENSMSVSKELGAQWVLIGHSERRTLFGESNEDVLKKLELSQKLGLSAMVCIGETLEERESGKTEDLLKEQLSALSSVSFSDQVVFAYEPVWAIGTGKVATPEQVDETHGVIRKILNDLQPGSGDRALILYGGSVKPGNAGELGKLENVNGFLVGGASLKTDSFTEILRQSGRVS